MIEILEYKANINPGVIVANFTCKFHKMGGLVLKGFTHCRSNEKSWINPPSTSYEKDGQKKYVWMVFFENAEINKRFKDEIYKSLKIHLDGPNVNQASPKEEGVPF